MKFVLLTAVLLAIALWHYRWRYPEMQPDEYEGWKFV